MSGTDSSACPGERIFCPECGEQIPDTCRFCIWCGSNLAFIRPYLDKKREQRGMSFTPADSDRSRDISPVYPGSQHPTQRQPASGSSGDLYPGIAGSLNPHSSPDGSRYTASASAGPHNARESQRAPDISGDTTTVYQEMQDSIPGRPLPEISGNTSRTDACTHGSPQCPPAPVRSAGTHPAGSAWSPDPPCIDPDVNLTDFHGYADALKNEGDACYHQGEYHEAIYFYDVALGINPDFEPAWNNKGLTLVKLGRIREAESCLDEVRRLRQRPAIPDTGISDDLVQESPSLGQEPGLLV